MSDPAIGHFDLREMVRGGLPPLSDTAGPVTYARRLARYIRDASTIRARTINEYGCAPAIDEIKAMQAKARDERAVVRLVAERDTPDASEDPRFWATPGLIRLAAERRAIAARVQARIAAERLDASENATDRPVTMVTARDVIALTARVHGLTAADLIGRSRDQAVVKVRNMAVWILLQRGRLSQSQIGRILDGRDHTTVSNARRRFDDEATPEQRAVACRIVGWGNPTVEQDVPCPVPDDGAGE